MPGMLWRLTAAFVVLPALAAIPAMARAGVAFVQPEPIQLERKQNARTTVEVFNGSPRCRTLRLRVLAAGDGRVSVRAQTPERSWAAPAGGVRTRPGRTATFELVAERTPGAAVTAAVVATSSDGTIARTTLQIGTPPSAPAPPATFPAKVDAGTTSLAPHIDLRLFETGSGKSSEARVPIAPMPRDVVFSKRVGTLYSDSRRTVAVTLDKERNELVIDRAPERGTYSGQIDVNGTEAKGGTSEVTLDVRHGWLLPLAVLLAGIGVGFGVEWWLTRLRPRSLLDRRLGRLLERAERRRRDVDTTLKSLFLESHGLSRTADDTTRAAWLADRNLTEDDLKHGLKGQWALPRAAVADTSADLLRDKDPRNGQISRYYFSRAARDLATLLREARTDTERELFGPDGDRIKELLTDEDTYAELVEELREAAYTLRGPLHDIADDFSGKRSPMRERLDDACNGWTIGDRQYLLARRDAAKAFHAMAEQYAGFRARLQTAIDELPDDAQTLRECIVSRRRLLDTTFRGDADQVTFWTGELPKVEAAVYAGGTTPTPLTPGPAELPLIAPLERAPDPPAPPPASPPPKAAGDSPWPAGRWVVRGAGLTGLEWLVGIVSLVTIAATGMSVLYFTNDTFGSFGDYLAIALWGSTATAAVALLRRLLPGATSTRLPGVGS